MYKEKIGIIGGFGAYATLNFYKRILEVFKGEKEWDYPHIIMDNNFTMPSRTRALLFDESYEEIVEEIGASMKRMISLDVDYIVLVCGTAHCFLEDVYKLVPEAEKRVLDIINLLGMRLKEMGEKEALVVAAEGTLSRGLYERRLEQYGMACITPQEEDYGEIRYFIECVKRNEIDGDTAERFLTFLRGYGVTDIILGCTEFPVLVDYISGLEMGKEKEMEYRKYRFLDPMEITIDWLKNHMV